MHAHLEQANSYRQTNQGGGPACKGWVLVLPLTSFSTKAFSPSKVKAPESRLACLLFFKLMATAVGASPLPTPSPSQKGPCRVTSTQRQCKALLALLSATAYHDKAHTQGSHCLMYLEVPDQCCVDVYSRHPD